MFVWSEFGMLCFGNFDINDQTNRSVSWITSAFIKINYGLMSFTSNTLCNITKVVLLFAVTDWLGDWVNEDEFEMQSYAHCDS